VIRSRLDRIRRTLVSLNEWRRLPREDQDALIESRFVKRQSTDILPPGDPGVDVDVPLECAGAERGWMQTVTGRRFYPLAPRSEDIDIHDVAHGLAMCCRYAGHTSRFYSVAEHCVHVSREVERTLRDANVRADIAGPYGARKNGPIEVLQWSLAALLHDSSEAYLGDMIRPVKHQPEMDAFRTAEARIERAVTRRFSLTENPRCWDLVKEIDNRILVDEIAALKRDPSMYADVTGKPLGVRIECWSPESAKHHFLHRYEGLVLAIARAEEWDEPVAR
jgi:hypothetical protein